MRILILLLAALSPIAQAGTLENPRITEASGLARSHIDDSHFWVINDGGHAPVLFAIDDRGRDLGEVAVQAARNHDWEDLASFTLDDKPMLLIADIGDNLGIRDHLTLYVIDEPPPGVSEATITWQLDVRLPGGAADAEAVAVDTAGNQVFILTKREIPAAIYRVPLQSADRAELLAERLITLDTLPQPTDDDRSNAPRNMDWHWQPTAMDISPDASAVAILTYRSLYLYRRSDGESLLQALQRQPAANAIGGLSNPEAAAFAADGHSVYVTIEKQHAPLLRIDLSQGQK